MKYVISCILCFLVLSHGVRAELKFGGGVSAGLAFPPSTLIFDLKALGYSVKRNIEAKPFSMGFAVGAVGQLSVNKWFSARLCIDYMRFGTDASKIVEDMDKAFRENGITPGTGELKASMGGQSVFDFRLLGTGKYPTGTIVSPYVSFGPLFLSRSSNDIDLTLGPDQEKVSIEGGFFVGITYGIGAEFAIGKSSTVFIEVNDLYTWPKSGAWGPSQVLVGFIYQ